MEFYMNKSVVAGAMVAVFLSACDNTGGLSPNLSKEEISLMNRNQRSELERRCIGVTNETCFNLSSVQGSKKSLVDYCKLRVQMRFKIVGAEAEQDIKRCEEDL